MRLDPHPRFPADISQAWRKFTDLFRDVAQQVNAAADGQIFASNNAQSTIPTTGTYAKGDFVRKSSPSVSGSGVVVGWLRITDGSSHTLNTDWVECVIPTVSFFPASGGAALRVGSAGEIAAQDDSLGVLEFYSRDASANSTGVFGRVGVYNEFPGGWDGTLARVDTYMAFSTAKDGTMAERVRIDDSGDVHTYGQIRAGGWNAGSTAGTVDGAAVEIGYSGGEGYAIAYDRTGATYKTMNVQGTDVKLLAEGGDVYVDVAKTTAPTIGTNGQMVFNLTSDTNLRISVRGSDGTTRIANITLA